MLDYCKLCIKSDVCKHVEDYKNYIERGIVKPEFIGIECKFRMTTFRLIEDPLDPFPQPQDIFWYGTGDFPQCPNVTCGEED